MSRFDLVKKLIREVKIPKTKQEALEILNKITSPEEAQALTGADKDKYLKALDLAQGSRSSRMEEMGFGPETWYHGTKADIKAFDPNLRGSTTAAPDASDAFFFANNPEVASQYADWFMNSPGKYGKVRELMQNKIDEDLANLPQTKEILELEAKKSRDPKDLKRKNELFDFIREQRRRRDADAEMELSQMGSQLYPVHLKMQKPITADMSGKNYSPSDYEEILRKMKLGKRDAALIKNTNDSLGSFDETVHDVAAIKNPEQIRSTSAAFDTRFAKSPNILAGVSAIPLLEEKASLSDLKRKDEQSLQAKTMEEKYGAFKQDTGSNDVGIQQDLMWPNIKKDYEFEPYVSEMGAMNAARLAERSGKPLTKEMIEESQRLSGFSVDPAITTHIKDVAQVIKKSPGLFNKLKKALSHVGK